MIAFPLCPRHPKAGSLSTNDSPEEDPPMIRRLLTGLLLGLLLCVSLPAMETEVLFDGTDASLWTTARDETRLTKELSASEVKSE